MTNRRKILSLWLLIAARAAQGLGAAIMMALTMAFVGETVPKEKTGSAMGLLGTMSAIGTALGPSLGGVLIAARHIWIQAQPPGTVAACGADLDYLLDIMPVTEVVTKVLTGSGECGKVDWTLLGLSMPWWVLISLVALGAWAVVANLRSAS